MITQQLWVPGILPNLNDIVEAAKGAGGRGRNYSELKRNLTGAVRIFAIKARLKPMHSAHFHYLFIEKAKRRDKSNVFAGIKFIEDGLVAAKVFVNDGWTQVLSITPDFKVADKDRDLGVLVTMSDHYTEIEKIRARVILTGG